MITMQEWKAMSGREQTLWMEANNPVSEYAITSRKLIVGIGVNDSFYSTSIKINGSNFRCPAYIVWKDMIRRCYSGETDPRRASYSGVLVCEEWQSFTGFRGWWLSNHIEGWQVDKDILTDERLYSPNTCIVIPSWLNSFTLNGFAARGSLPVGVTPHRKTGKYQAQCKNPLSKRNDYLGLFSSSSAAHLAWRARKLEIAAELKPRMDEIDMRIYPRVVEIINNAK